MSTTTNDAPRDGHRDGATHDASVDYVRLNRQLADVWRVMRDGRWRTLREISAASGHPEASVSARIRDFRKERFGGHSVQRQRIEGDGYNYRLERRRGVRMAAPKPRQSDA